VIASGRKAHARSKAARSSTSQRLIGQPDARSSGIRPSTPTLSTPRQTQSIPQSRRRASSSNAAGSPNESHGLRLSSGHDRRAPGCSALSRRQPCSPPGISTAAFHQRRSSPTLRRSSARSAPSSTRPPSFRSSLADRPAPITASSQSSKIMGRTPALTGSWLTTSCSPSPSRRSHSTHRMGESRTRSSSCGRFTRCHTRSGVGGDDPSGVAAEAGSEWVPRDPKVRHLLGARSRAMGGGSSRLPSPTGALWDRCPPSRARRDCGSRFSSGSGTVLLGIRAPSHSTPRQLWVDTTSPGWRRFKRAVAALAADPRTPRMARVDLGEGCVPRWENAPERGR
jgi:hypothetical protein